MVSADAFESDSTAGLTPEQIQQQRIGQAMVQMYGPQPLTQPTAPAGPTPTIRDSLVKLGLVKPEAEVSKLSIAPGAPKDPNQPDTSTSPVAQSIRGPLEKRGVIAPQLDPMDHTAAPAQPAQQQPLPFRMPGTGGPSGMTRGMNYLDQMAGYDKDTIAALGTAKDANLSAGLAKKTLADQTQATNADLNNQLGDLETQKQDHMQNAVAQMNLANQQTQARMDQLKKIDPNRWWNSKDAAHQVTFSIGLALSTLGSLMPHTSGNGKNVAMDIMQNGIQADVEAQKTDLDSEWKKITKGEDIAKDTWARAQWKADQLDKAKLLSIEKAKNTLAGYQAQSGSAEDQAKIAAMNAQLTHDQSTLGQSMSTRYFQFQQAQAAAAAGGGLAALKTKWDKLADEAVQKGEQPISFGDYARLHMTGSGGTPAGASPVAGIPKDQRESAGKELEKISQWNQDKAALDTQGKSLAGASTNVLDHPVDAAMRAIGKQSTEGFSKGLNDEAYNATLRSAAHKVAGARSPEAMEHIIGGMTLNPGDNPQTRAQKIALGTGFMLRERPATPTLDAFGKTPQVPGAPGNAGPTITPGWK